MTTQNDEARFGIMSHRSAGSILGAASAPAKNTDGSFVWFATEAEAMAKAKEWTDRLLTRNVHYSVYRL